MNVKDMLTAYAAENGVKMEFDENGACTLPLDGDRVLHLQFRDEIGELDFLAILGTVPKELRGYVFQKLLAANYYWRETLGATLSWHEELGQVVLTYPVKTETTDEATLRGILEHFIDLQEVWTERLQLDITEAETDAELEEASADLSDLTMPPEAEEATATLRPSDEIRFDA